MIFASEDLKGAIKATYNNIVTYKSTIFTK